MVHLSRIAITVTLAALVSSCTTQPNSHAPGDRDTPPDFEPIYTSSWSAEPGIDLLSREAELIRATFESSWQTEMYSITNSFPGYREAIGYPHPSIQNIVRGADAGNTDWDQVSKHTIRYHITELIETPTDITASICDDIVYTETTTNDHITRHGLSWTASLHNTADTPGLPGIADTDRANHDPRARRTPDWNVFGTWRITHLIPQSLNMEKHVAEPACTAWWLANHPDTLKVDGNTTFRAAGVVPGTPLAPQFPEWIGPAEVDDDAGRSSHIVECSAQR